MHRSSIVWAMDGEVTTWSCCGRGDNATLCTEEVMFLAGDGGGSGVQRLQLLLQVSHMYRPRPIYVLLSLCAGSLCPAALNLNVSPVPWRGLTTGHFLVEAQKDLEFDCVLRLLCRLSDNQPKVSFVGEMTTTRMEPRVQGLEKTYGGLPNFLPMSVLRSVPF